MSRDNSVGITVYGLDDRGLGVSYSSRARDCFSRASRSPLRPNNGSGDCFSGIKWPENEADYLHQCSAEVRNISPLLHVYCWHGARLSIRTNLSLKFCVLIIRLLHRRLER